MEEQWQRISEFTMRFNGLMAVAFIFILLVSGSVYAHGEETFAQAEEIIMDSVSCDDLTDDQLEILGDYYMEQMHPGELHEIMDARMGGEGSESLRQVHINMGLAFYCGEHEEFSGSMMNVMMGRSAGNSYMGYGMMGGYGSSWSGYWFMWIFWILVIVALALLIVWLVRQLNKKPRKR